MRWGLLADIHEAVEPLRTAVAELTARRVDRFMVLGDVLDHGEHVDETVEVLAALPGTGVWGNHDFGMCGEVDELVRARFSPRVLDYFRTLRPRVTVDGALFQHIDPNLDPEKFGDLWSFPTPAERIAGLAKCRHPRMFMGHLHGWGLFAPGQHLPWEGEAPLRYEAGRQYLTVVHAVVDGWCAVLDTDRDVLEPVRIR